MPEVIKVSAPGKVLWIGSYSVVFGGISHVIAVNKRVRCEVAENNEWVIETSYGTFKGYGNELTSSVINTMKKFFGSIGPYRVKLFNDPDFQVNGKKTGLGSSAAATVALTAALYFAVSNKLDLIQIHKIAQIANYNRQKGIGSGFDIAAAVFGSIVYKRFTDIEKMDFYYKKLELPPNISMILGFTGKSSITIELVRKFIEASSNEKFLYYLNLINKENEIAINLL
ncbi:MAG: GHMP kinase, partial [Sulfolobaceae archaeon]